MEVMIVSAFGRGNALAVGLQRLGLQVKLLDLTQSLGTWILEDAEGPFGISDLQSFGSLASERFHQDDPLMEVPQGMTIWLEDGPLEMRGPTGPFRMKALGLRGEGVVNNLKHWWSAAIYPGSSQVESCPIDKTLHVRWPTRPGFEQNLTWLAEQGVQVFPNMRVEDVSLRGPKNIVSLEVRKISENRSELMSASQFVWFLNSAETEFLSKKLAEKIFPRGVIHADWCWQRFRMDIQFDISVWPLQMMLLGNPQVPWTHANAMVVRKTAAKDQIDVWMLLASQQRFHRSYLTDMAGKAIDVLRQRCPGASIKVVEFPISFEKSLELAGPLRQPVFSQNQWKDRSLSKFQNLVFDHHELSLKLGFESQRTGLGRILKHFETVLLEQRRREQKMNPDNEEANP